MLSWGFVPSPCFLFNAAYLFQLNSLVQKSCNQPSPLYWSTSEEELWRRVFRLLAEEQVREALVFCLLALLVQKYLLSDLQAAVSYCAANLMSAKTSSAMPTTCRPGGDSAAAGATSLHLKSEGTLEAQRSAGRSLLLVVSTWREQVSFPI